MLAISLAPPPRATGQIPWGSRRRPRTLASSSRCRAASIPASSRRMLAREGYDVVGLTMQLYDHGAAVHRKGACCAGQDIHDARDVAARSAFPTMCSTTRSGFREKVIEPFAEAYVQGETPIPCVACNQHMKFVDLFGAARDLGADVLQPAITWSPPTTARADGRSTAPPTPTATRATSCSPPRCDQFKSALPARRADEERSEGPGARVFAAVADKADSQDICFVPAGHYSDMIERLRPGAAEPGEIVHVDGRVLGRHNGILHYTIGQRRGIGIAAGEPLYVIKLDAERARVIVGPRRHLATPRVKLRDFNWIGPGVARAVSEGGLAVAARVRSTRPPVAARLVCRCQR